MSEIDKTKTWNLKKFRNSEIDQKCHYEQDHICFVESGADENKCCLTVIILVTDDCNKMKKCVLKTIFVM